MYSSVLGKSIGYSFSSLLVCSDSKGENSIEVLVRLTNKQGCLEKTLKGKIFENLIFSRQVKMQNIYFLICKLASFHTFI